MHIKPYSFKSLSVFLFVATVFGAACTDASEGTGLALVNIRLIDAPGDFDQAWIEIDAVEVMQGTDRQGADAQWRYIPYDQANQQVDVSQLVGEGVLLLGRAEVPAGGIFKIKLILGGDHYLNKNGKTRSLTLANPEASVIEMDVNYRLERSLSYDIYLDFDLEKSIKATSDSTRFLLDPRVRSFVKEERSEIRGRIQPSAAKPVIYAIQEKDTVTTLTDAQGNYSLRGLEEGKYALYILPRPPYRDTLFAAETQTGEVTAIENIILRLPLQQPDENL